MVISIAFFMEALNLFNLSNKKEVKFTRIIVVGSNYSSKEKRSGMGVPYR